jgi:hypothetical protein
MRPRPWLKPAIDANRDQIKELLSDGAAGRDLSLGLEGAVAGADIDAGD